MQLSRRTFLMGAGASAPVIWAQRKSAGPRPNFVLVLAGDLGAWLLGCYGNQEVRTPNLDLFARMGTRFLHHSVCTPAGAPSRATLLTGRVPRQHGIQDDLRGAPAPASFGKELLLSDLLAQAGYNCGYAGAWGLGDDAQAQHGFRTWRAVQDKDYQPELVTRSAVQFLEGQKPDQPFFLVASHRSPYAPYDGLPQKYYDLYAKTTFLSAGWLPAASNAAEGKEFLKDTVGSLRKCAAAVTALDDQILPLTEVLDKKGIRDQTLVIFTAASGLLAGRHGLWDAGRGSNPINMYTEAIETPMIWNWPGKVPVEGGRTELVASYDLFPSLCELARVGAPKKLNLCGRSYAALAMNQPLPRKQPWRNLVFGSFEGTEMARDLRFKVVIRGNGAGPNELYDLREDPQERVNHYGNAAYVTVRNSLGESLRRWREKTV